jgi:riboflavin synthase
MFTGIVEEVGVVQRVDRRGDVVRLDVRAGLTLEGSAIGASVAVNGACLTVVDRRPDAFAFEVGPETLARTTLGGLRPGSPVNLERPLRLGGALGGHLVLGHVDAVGTVETLHRVESTARVRIGFESRDLEPLMIPQGSVAVDGVSLTIAALLERALEIMVIPHTLAATTFGHLRPGQPVNIEADVIGKYVVRSLALREGPGGAS